MIHRTPTERSFGLTVGGAFLLLAALTAWRGRSTLSIAFTAAGGILVLGAVVAPAALRIPNRIWWRFAQMLGWFNARVILSVFFFVVLTPAGLVMRLFGRNPLRRERGDSSWSMHSGRRADPRHYERMF